MNYEQKYKEALGWMQSLYKGLHGATKEDAEHYFPELVESEDEKIRKALIEMIHDTTGDECEDCYHVSKESILAWLEKQGEQKQTWEPDAAQLIVIKDLIEDKNTSKVNKVILRGMLDEFKQFTNTNKREIDDAYLQGICDAKHEIEKQGEQKTDPCIGCTNDKGCVTCENGNLKEIKIEPKFKVGDWVVSNNNRGVWQVGARYTEEGQRIYLYNVNDVMMSITLNELNNDYHHWTIQDAKDGDVLATEDGRPFIIRCMVESKNDIPSAYCGINARPIEAFIITGYSPGTSKWTNSKVHPATKEQRDLLFQKMKEAGYEWDTEKKEVKKIEPKTLNADEVIAWLVGNIIDFEDYVRAFKQDFGL